MAGRRGGVYRRRARLHEACGAMGLCATAVWAVFVLHGSPALADRARWWSVVNVVGFAAVALAGRALRGANRAALALDCSCTIAVIVILSAWIGASGGAGGWLVGLPPALIVAHWVSGGRVMGVLAWASASSLYAGVLLVVGGNVVASVEMLGAPAGSGADVPIVPIGVLGAFAAAAVLGWELERSADPSRRAARPTSLRRPALGETVAGKYRLVQIIGEGAMGRVYEAERVSDGACVAVKILHDHLAQEPQLIARFRRETEIASRLPPERIAPVFDFGSAAPGVEYIAMERLQGEDLSSRLRRIKRLSCEDTLLLIEQIAEALDAAAKAGVVHRDVHPRNVFLVRGGEGALDARLLDFGMSRLSGTEFGAMRTRSTAVLGTPGFLAPEQVSDAFGEVGPHTDVFALACIAYLALCGHKAFEATDPAAGVYEVLNHHPAPVRSILPELPEAIDWVLSLALAKRTVDRYRRAGDFARDLRGAATGDLSASISRRVVSLTNELAPQTETLST